MKKIKKIHDGELNFHTSRMASKNKFSDFAINSGPTSSLFTGGNIDHTMLSGRGTYLYAEAGNRPDGTVFMIRTPTVDLTKPAEE